MKRVVQACRTTTGIKASVLLRGVTYIRFSSVIAKHSSSWLFEPVHVHCACSYAVCDGTIGRDPY
jgi:hypothetical protein